MALVIALGAALGGCSHQVTPQQQFLEALKRGNSAQASQIWLHMNPEERVKFERGQGLQPAQTPKEMQQEVMRRAMEQSDDDNTPDQSSVTPALGGDLGNLPCYLNSQQAGGGASP